MASAGELRFIPVKLGDRWSGIVFVEGHDPPRARDGQPSLDLSVLPPPDVWRDWLERLIHDRESLPGYRVLKYAKTAIVAAADSPMDRDPSVGGSRPVICRYGTPDGWERLLGPMRRSRPKRNLKRALALLRSQIATARPLAFVERSSGNREAWLVTEFLSDTLDLDQVLSMYLPQLPAGQARAVRNGLIEAVAGLLAGLEGEGFSHRDLKASNILMASWDGRAGSPRAMIVDLDGLRPRRWWRLGQSWQPLVRLAASVMDHPHVTRTDLVRFLRAYVTLTAQPSDAWKSHVRKLANKARNYAQHSRRRKGHKLDGYVGAGGFDGTAGPRS